MVRLLYEINSQIKTSQTTKDSSCVSINRSEQCCKVTCVTLTIELMISNFLNTCKISTGPVLCVLTLKQVCQFPTHKASLLVVNAFNETMRLQFFLWMG